MKPNSNNKKTSTIYNLNILTAKESEVFKFSLFSL